MNLKSTCLVKNMIIILNVNVVSFAVVEHIVVCCKCCKFSCSSPRDSDEDKEAFSFNLCSDGDGLLLHGTYTQRVVHTTLYLDLLEEDVEAATAPYNFNHITLF